MAKKPIPMNNNDLIGYTWLALLIFIYFLPTISGWNKANRGAIFALNFFLGWTFIGWVVALVWSLTKDRQ
jgi:hypothetical protein